MIAFAMYWPTAGNSSICSRPEGNLPPRLDISVANDLREVARLRHSPIGLRNTSRSSRRATASASHDGNLSRKDAKNLATVSALVRCNRVSAMTFSYSLAELLLQGSPWRPRSDAHERISDRKRSMRTLLILGIDDPSFSRVNCARRANKRAFSPLYFACGLKSVRLLHFRSESVVNCALVGRNAG